MSVNTAARSGHPVDEETWKASHAVLLPVVGDLQMHPWLAHLLSEGCSSVVLGETRDEYVAREMSSRRLATETREAIGEFVSRVRAAADDRDVLVAVDQEPWGIQRLQGLVTEPLTSPLTTPGELRSYAAEVARVAREMGVNVFLSPVLDILNGGNPWLRGRTLQDCSPTEHARHATEFILGTQSAGVAAVAKHFPGFPHLEKDPAVDITSIAPGGWHSNCLDPFRSAVAAGVSAVMLGPAAVADLDANEPASTSEITVRLLREELRFGGLIVSDDLDAPATTVGRSLSDTMVASVRAGADLLLVAGGDHLEACVQYISETADRDPELRHRLLASAQRVRSLARSLRSHATEWGSGQGDVRSDRF